MDDVFTQFHAWFAKFVYISAALMIAANIAVRCIRSLRSRSAAPLREPATRRLLLRAGVRQ
jgi:hypothetical protein